ncbi:uncharacterized protein LOC144134571 isoform X2 [Amblyomma americanum]
MLRLLGRSSSTSKTAWYRHWAAVFVYPDGKALYCDANQEASSGDLVGTVAWRTVDQLALMDIPKVPLGKHRVSPASVSAALREMCECGRYHLTDNNCQEWVLELLRRLGIEPPPKDVPPAARAVVRETAGPLAAGLLAALAGGGLLVAALAGSVAHHSARTRSTSTASDGHQLNRRVAADCGHACRENPHDGSVQ